MLLLWKHNIKLIGPGHDIKLLPSRQDVQGCSVFHNCSVTFVEIGRVLHLLHPHCWVWVGVGSSPPTLPTPQRSNAVPIPCHPSRSFHLLWHSCLARHPFKSVWPYQCAGQEFMPPLEHCLPNQQQHNRKNDKTPHTVRSANSVCDDVFRQ